MSRLMKYPDGTWRATRRVANHIAHIYVREIGHGYFGCTVYNSHTGIELADTIGETRKVAVDRALAAAKRQFVMPTKADFSAAFGPCNK